MRGANRDQPVFDFVSYNLRYIQMKHFQQLASATLILASSWMTASAGIVIDASLRGVIAAPASQSADQILFSDPGAFSDSVSLVTDSGRAYSASQTSNIDPAGHFWGSGSATSSESYFDGFSSTAYGRTFYTVDFTIDTPYLFTFVSTIFSNPVLPSQALATLLHVPSSTLIAGNFGASGQFDSGVLAPGSYKLTVDEYASATDHTTNFDFDFQLTDPTNPVVPEPASIAVWGCLGLTAVGYRWRRARTSQSSN
jgi:hypothetical protein